ncbi:molybdate ABC transporter substrate-binding protein [Thiohalocapsa sp. ML1]|jgi:molybdate transport system substrate-binding protein|uniref:molybdate ABC transporter substrate-binding protein n=1 Tax=Thiohalocapsa sp. ML1 TaxID=1431688 RepID=UPI00073237FE|nr:molybdate ABC transporter substrate-binding protein [Thiohalocapsa sp. ML1]
MKNLVTASAVLAVALAAGNAAAEEATIAVAANFTAPMKIIAEMFAEDTEHTVVTSFGATGKFYAQIKNGAPFEALLAADEKTPKKLADEGAGVADSRFTYAIGTLVLWSAKPDLVEDGKALLASGDFNKLSIANPKLAPYGVAAVQTMEAMGLKDALEPKLVMGENIAQTFQFVDTGNADLGFVALSQVMQNGEITKGSGWVVPADMHAPIRQDAIMLEPGKDNPAVAAFLEYLKSERALEVIHAFGYETE